MQLLYKKVSIMGLLLGISLIFSYIETLFIIPVGLPGVKIGLSNIITVIGIYTIGPCCTFIVLLARVLLAGFLFSTGIGIVYSLCGAVVSFLFMLCLYKVKQLSVIGISAIAGVVHNVSQIFVAMIFMKTTSVLYYIPALIISGLIAGVVVGVLSKGVLNKVGSSDLFN